MEHSTALISYLLSLIFYLLSFISYLTKAMSRDSITFEKSKRFASRVVKLYSYLTRKNEFVMSKQVLRAGTSIGANLAESVYAASTSDFLNKVTIALKECNETRYWLELLHDNSFITKRMYVSILADCDDILHLLISTVKTLRTRISKESK